MSWSQTLNIACLSGVVLLRAAIAFAVLIALSCRTFGQTNPVVTLLANHYGHKEYDDPSGYFTFINYTSIVSMQFSAQLPSKINSSMFESQSANVSGSIHFIAHAEDHYFGQISINDYDVTESYSLLGQGLYIDFLASDGSVNYISTSLPYGTDSTLPRTYALKYLGGISFMTNFIRMPDPFDFDLTDYFPGPAIATVTGNGSSFSGLVEDASTGNPLTGATVVIGGETLITDATGSFFLSLVPPGSLTIQITDSGYGSYIATKNLPPFSAIQQTFKLNSAPTITTLRVTQNQALADLTPEKFNVPITPTTFSSILGSGQMNLGAGVVADGVTPVLFMIKGTPGTYSLTLITSDATSSANVTYTGGSLANKLYVLNEINGWTQTTNITLQPDSTGINGTAYAYLQGMNWTNFFYVTPPANQVNAILTLHSNAQQIASANFGIRPVPIVLVHGIGDTGDTWSQDFMNELAHNVPGDFIIPITYGLGTGLNHQLWPSSASDFLSLAKEVDTDLHNVEAQLQSKWDFTRYDAVGHSQGGVLLRMLCQTAGQSGYGAFTSDAFPVVSPQNFYRGRFRKIVTIGAPQNGSLICYYLDQILLNQSGSVNPAEQLFFDCVSGLVYFNAPALQKFDPSGWQIRFINNKSFPVDSRIGFHSIQATINGGLPPSSDASGNPPIYNFCALQYTLPSGPYAGQTRGQALIPRGSDGIVDLVSQGGALGAATGEDFTYIAHCIGGAFFGVSSNSTETADLAVGIDTANLLSGPDSKFGPFILPPPITQSTLTLYNSLAPSILTVVGAIIQGVIPHTPSTNINYYLTVPSNLPLDGTVNWQGLNYSTNGISTNGVSLLVNTNDSTQMTLTINGGIVGQVVISAEYMTTNGNIVFATPIVASSIPTSFGATLTNIELQPTSISLTVGETIPTQIVGDYSDGTQSYLYTPPEQVIYVSSNPQIASADTNGNVRLNAQGAASIQATYNGFTVQMTVSTVTPLFPQLLFAVKTNGGFGFFLFSSVGVTNIVQTSTDLINWVAVANLLPTNGLTQFVDSNSSNFPHRFYRVMLPP